ncbi:MAG: type II toxin-antitoxin system VapC family toxin [Azospirillaceae bacterium]|nr:type II toxin-antitoxin system VapC family toxin [Azospirillaceae bacterium]
MTVVVDTSALFAILFGESEGRRCITVLAEAERPLISAATVAEALIVAGRRGQRTEMERLIARLGAEIIPMTDGAAVADAYDRWGKGVHRAGLNFGDCFAYALAKDRGCRILFVGEDFAQTDLPAA